MPVTLTHWGAYDVTVLGGRRVDVRPVADDPDPSPLGANVAALADHPVRVRRPAVRRGFLDEVASGRRGRRSDRGRGHDAFVEVDWGTALDLVAAEIDRVRSEAGPASIYAGSYGWASAGRVHNPQTWLFRMLGLAGGFTRTVNSYSYAAAEVILPHVVGNFFDVLGNHTPFEELARHGRLVVAFGGLPSKNTQVENGGTYRHLAPGGLRALRDAGVRIVNVSPLRGDVDASLGASWLPIRPGTDTALLLALAHTLVAEDLADRAFLDRYCSGVEPFLRTVAACPPEWAEPICGVPAPEIRALARDLAAGPSLVTASWSLQRADHGEHVYWAVIALAALLGQIGTPGGGFGVGYGSVNRVGSAESRFSLPRVPAGVNPVKGFVPVARVTEALECPGASFTYDGAIHHYPDTRLVYWAGGNPFHHHQDLGRLARAWQLPECVVVHEHVWNALARHADIVLPAATLLERDDVGSSPQTGTIVAMPRILEPLGEARTDREILSGVAHRLGVGEQFDEGRDDRAWLEWVWAETVERAARDGVTLPDLEGLFAVGSVDLPRPTEPRVLLAPFRADPDGAPLRTPSGRIELHSEVLAAFDHPDVPAGPCWRAPQEWLGAPLAARFPLHLVSNQPATRLHSQLDVGAASQAGKVAGREALRMHPADAAARGLGDGDVVRVHNDRGACLAGVVVDDGVVEGVVVLPTGAWYDPVEPGGLCRAGNPNVLTSDRPTSSLAQAPAAQSCLVEVTRWEGPVPERTVDRPPPFVAGP